MHNVPLLLSLAATTLAFASLSPAQEMDETTNTLISMEQTALDRWSKGDPDGFLEISDSSVVYFDPFVERRLNGRDELKKLYEQVRGKIHIDSYEMIDPKVQVAGDIAVLTYNFVSHNGEGTMRWNTTEVYRRKESKWRIIHTHWSLTQPRLASN
jgi:ketosteroid isomerase-like protein